MAISAVNHSGLVLEDNTIALLYWLNFNDAQRTKIQLQFYANFSKFIAFLKAKEVALFSNDC